MAMKITMYFGDDDGFELPPERATFLWVLYEDGRARLDASSNVSRAWRMVAL
jgi:hypothetical protein